MAPCRENMVTGQPVHYGVQRRKSVTWFFGKCVSLIVSRYTWVEWDKTNRPDDFGSAGYNAPGLGVDNAHLSPDPFAGERGDGITVEEETEVKDIGAVIDRVNEESGKIGGRWGDCRHYADELMNM